MKILIATILSAVMSWVVDNKTTVHLAEGGLVPYDIETSYHNTYNKGQVRQGDTATLVLGHLDGIEVDQIELSMRANASSGAGQIVVTANDEPLATHSVSYHDVGNPVVAFSGCQQEVDELVIQVIGEQNSLYVDAFTVTWQQAVRPAYTVTLMNGDAVYTTLTETQAGAGVALPILSNMDHWGFLGWSEVEFGPTDEWPTYLRGGTLYKPASDATLWAVYQYQEMTGEKPCTTELVSGVYRYVNRELHLALTGVPVDGRMASAPIDAYDDNQHYMITYNDKLTQATITHEPTGTPIGYSTITPKLTETASWWKVYHDGEEILFYATIQGKNYVLWLSIDDIRTQTTYAGLLEADPMTSPMGLQDTFMPEELFIVTCHPEWALGVDEVTDKAEGHTEKIVQIGIYELHIKNGKKQIILR